MERWEKALTVSGERDLPAIREEIDGVDAALRILLLRREALTEEARVVKAKAGLPARDIGRELEIIRKAAPVSAAFARLLGWAR